MLQVKQILKNKSKNNESKNPSFLTRVLQFPITVLLYKAMLNLKRA
jgi:hypothetical protein